MKTLRHLLFLPVLFLLGLSCLFFAPPTNANPVIPAIGNLKPNDSKTITISSLTPGTKYHWRELRAFSTILGRRTETKYEVCFDVDSSGSRTGQIGPYPDEGDYEIYVSKAATGRFGACVQDPTEQSMQKFTVNASLPTGSFPASGGPPRVGCPGFVGDGIQTALGCIPIENTGEFIKWTLRWAIGIAGGIAFLLILSSGFQIMTSAGSPDKLKAGQEQLTAAISGLLFILFSVFLLKLIGLDILQIPGFGTP